MWDYRTGLGFDINHVTRIIKSISSAIEEPISVDGCIYTEKYRNPSEVYDVISNYVMLPAILLPFVIDIEQTETGCIIKNHI